MSRKNKVLEGAFTELYGNYLKVLENCDPDMASKETKSWEDAYHEHITSNDLQYLVRIAAMMEVVILQRRILDNLNNMNIVLGIQADHIYAMVTFFRNDKRAKDIRVYPGRVATYGSDLKVLYDNPAFMKKTRDMLAVKMMEKIEESEEQLNDFFVKQDMLSESQN